MAAKLGVDVQESDYQLDATELSNTLIARAKEAGKSEQEINEAFAE